MRSWVLAAGLLLAAAAVSPAMAADLDGIPPPPWKGIYGNPYYPQAGSPPPPAYSDDDDDAAYRPPPPARQYSDIPPPPGSCVRSEQVRERLTSRGWRDFHDGKAINQTEATLKARRPNGRMFELKLDRCSGEIVAYRALEPRPLGPYAYRQPYGPGPYGDGRWGPQPAPNGYNGPDGPYDDKGPNGYGSNGYGYNGNGYTGPYAYGGPAPYGYPPPRWQGR